MAPLAESRLAKDLLHTLVPLRGDVRDDEALFDIIGSAPVVLIGESTHGTHEFYRARTEITKRLIADRGFAAVCVEADWSEAYRVDRYVRGAGGDDAVDSLGGFKRFPTWTWRNAVVLDFITWLREYNDRAPARQCRKAGFCTVQDGPAKTVVWTHNTNIGALARQFGDRVVSIGFTTYTGTVTAASQWNGRQERLRIVPARGDSYEYLFHSMNVPRMFVPLRPHRPKLAGLPQQARERAIGVIYRPQSEPSDNYFTARLIDQFDALYHFDETHALEPLDRSV